MADLTHQMKSITVEDKPPVRQYGGDYDQVRSIERRMQAITGHIKEIAEEDAPKRSVKTPYGGDYDDIRGIQSRLLKMNDSIKSLKDDVPAPKQRQTQRYGGDYDEVRRLESQIKGMKQELSMYEKQAEKEKQAVKQERPRFGGDYRTPRFDTNDGYKQYAPKSRESYQSRSPYRSYRDYSAPKQTRRPAYRDYSEDKTDELSRLTQKMAAITKELSQIQ